MDVLSTVRMMLCIDCLQIEWASAVGFISNMDGCFIYCENDVGRRCIVCLWRELASAVGFISCVNGCFIYRQNDAV